MVIRITHVITGLDHGGAESALTKIVIGLQERGFEQSVISLTTSGANGKKLENAGIPLQALGMTGAIKMLKGLPKLVRELKSTKPDIIQTWLYHADLLGLVTAQFIKKPAVVWNIRCADLRPDDVPRSTQILISILARLSPWVDAVLFNSYAGLEAHKKRSYKATQTLIIPNGFNLSEWRPDKNRRIAFRCKINVADDIFVVGIVARYHRMKNHTCFLEAAARVRSAQSRVRFVLVGAGIDWGNNELVENINRLGLEDEVQLLGARNDIAEIMPGFDCLVLTSTSEGFPNVIGEAMATGIPCVSTNVGDAQLIMGDTGRVVDVADSDSIANKILDLLALDQDKRNELSIRCRKHIEKNFGLECVVDRYAKFYGSLNEVRSKRK